MDKMKRLYKFFVGRGPRITDYSPPQNGGLPNEKSSYPFIEEDEFLADIIKRRGHRSIGITRVIDGPQSSTSEEEKINHRTQMEDDYERGEIKNG